MPGLVVLIAEVLWFLLKWWALVFSALLVLAVVASAVDGAVLRARARRGRQMRDHRRDLQAYLAEYGDDVDHVDLEAALKVTGGSRVGPSDRWAD